MENPKEIRKLSYKEMDGICNLLMIDDGWKNVMAEIPSYKTPGKKRFNQQDINNLVSHVQTNPCATSDGNDSY